MSSQILQNVSQGTSGTYTSGNHPMVGVDLMAMLNVTGNPAGTPTLDVYLQTSCDGGTNWQDIGHYAQVTTSAVVSFIIISGRQTGGTAAVAQKDAALAANTVTQGPIGDLVRVKYVIVAGSSGTYKFSVALSTR